MSLISESDGETHTTSRFPCAVIWEYLPSKGCAAGFTYEAWLAEFNIEDQLQRLAISGANLIVVATDGSSDTGVPSSGISVTELSNLPGCDFE